MLNLFCKKFDKMGGQTGKRLIWLIHSKKYFFFKKVIRDENHQNLNSAILPLFQKIPLIVMNLSPSFITLVSLLASLVATTELFYFYSKSAVLVLFYGLNAALWELCYQRLVLRQSIDRRSIKNHLIQPLSIKISHFDFGSATFDRLGYKLTTCQ